MIQPPGQIPTTSDDPRTVPFFRISLSNAALLSAVYPGAGASLEVVRRLFGFRWTEQALRALESFPMRMLDLVGLNEPLVHAYLVNDMSPWQMRLVLGSTTVVVIVLLALGVGAGMSVVAHRTAKR